MKKPFSILFIVVITVATTLPVQAEDTMTCTKTSAQEIAALFDRWNASLATLDPDKVLALYAPYSVLLPTLSNKPRTNHEEIRDYFVHFLEKAPQGKIDFRIIKIGCNSASDTGLYTFTLHDTKGKAKKVSARYSDRASPFFSAARTGQGEMSASCQLVEISDSPGGMPLLMSLFLGERGNVQGEFGGKRFEYSSLGVPEFARLLWRFACAIQHVEYDQCPESHVYLVAKKTK